MTKFDNAFKSIPNLKVESVATALDWSWLVDFGQGDFAQGKSAAEIVLLNDWNPDTLLARAIVHKLQGEYNKALSLFAEAFDLALGVDQKLIIATFAYLTEQKAQETLADGFAVSLNFSSSSIWFKRIQALTKYVPNINLRLQTNFLKQVAKILPYFRTLLVRQNNFAQKERYCLKIQSKLTRLLEIYQTEAVYAIAESLYTVLAQILSLTGQIRPAWELIDHLTLAYSDSQKFFQAAWFSLNQGDLIVTMASWGSPILFGYCVAEVVTSSQNQRKFDRSTIDRDTAQRLYSQAREFFSMAQIPRGEGMAIMRLAYLNAVGYQWNLAAFGYKEAKEYFTKTGDFLNVITAEMGHIWSSLQYQPLDDDCIAIIKQWMEWIQKQGAISWGISWSFAFALAAEEAVLINQEADVALRLIEVAEIIATELEITQSSKLPDSCQQLWQSCLLLLEKVARLIVKNLALNELWQPAFTLAEKVKIYETKLLNKNNNYFKYLLSSIPHIKDVSKQLQPGVLLLSYFLTDKALLIWGINHKGLIKHHIWQSIEDRPLKINLLLEKINDWFDSWAEYSVNMPRPKLLENIFLQPFLKEINAANHLIIILEKTLQGLPLSSLSINNNQQDFLGLSKTISYLNLVQELKPKNNIESTKINKLIFMTESGDIIDNKSNTFLSGDSTKLSLDAALMQTIINLYVDPENSNYRKETIKTVHLLLSSKTLFVAESIFKDLEADLAIFTIQDIRINQISSIELASITGSILCSYAKTVVIIFQGESAIATALLTFLLHQDLSFGYSVAKSLYQAQKRISDITTKEVIDFCQLLQNSIDWKNDSDRAIRGLITKYMGDILVLGGDYTRAREAYETAINIFNSTGYIAEACTLQENYEMFNSFTNTSQKTDNNRPIFRFFPHWNNGLIFGNFNLKNK